MPSAATHEYSRQPSFRNGSWKIRYFFGVFNERNVHVLFNKLEHNNRIEGRQCKFWLSWWNCKFSAPFIAKIFVKEKVVIYPLVAQCYKEIHADFSESFLVNKKFIVAQGSKPGLMLFQGRLNMKQTLLFIILNPHCGILKKLFAIYFWLIHYRRLQ